MNNKLYGVSFKNSEKNGYFESNEELEIEIEQEKKDFQQLKSLLSDEKKKQ